MSKKIALILSKVGLLLVAIGFFMPFASKTNVFGLMNDLSRAASWIRMDVGSYSFIVYLIFIASIVGVIMLCLSLAGKSMKLFYDWLPVIIANGSFLILLIRLANLANGLSRSFGTSSSGIKGLISDNLQIGAYCIIIGLISSVIFVIVASFISENLNRSNKSEITKKCPFCANDIKKEAIICQYCGKDVPVPVADVPVTDVPVVSVHKENLPNQSGKTRKADALLFIAVISCLLLLCSLSYAIYFANLESEMFGFFGNFIKLSYPIIIGLIAVIFNITGWKIRNNVFILIAGIAYGITTAFTMYYIKDFLNEDFIFDINFVLWNIPVLLLFSSIYCFIEFKKNRN
jgi:hypothetical protein